MKTKIFIGNVLEVENEAVSWLMSRSNPVYRFSVTNLAGDNQERRVKLVVYYIEK
jgi:hypothetical protein